MADLKTHGGYAPLTRDPAAFGAPADPQALEILWRTVRLVRASWRLVAGVCLATAVLAVLPALVRPREYTSEASFIPYTQRNASMFSGLAERLGVDVGQEKAQSPAFYADLVLAREVLRQAVEARYRTADGRTRPLVELLDVDEKSDALRTQAAMDMLRDGIIAGANQRTGLISLSVTLHDPVLAQQVGTRLIELVNSLNLQRRQGQGAAERRFTEQRVAELKAELNVAEDRLAAFLTRNRGYQADPELVNSARKLEQEVAFRRQVYTSLSSALEQAKLDEARDTPNVTVIDPPSLPVKPDSRGLALKLVLGVIAGLMFGTLAALLREVRLRA